MAAINMPNMMEKSIEKQQVRLSNRRPRLFWGAIS
jgi:hypothetical protein